MPSGPILYRLQNTSLHESTMLSTCGRHIVLSAVRVAVNENVISKSISVVGVIDNKHDNGCRVPDRHQC